VFGFYEQSIEVSASETGRCCVITLAGARCLAMYGNIA